LRKLSRLRRGAGWLKMDSKQRKNDR
jgi:hypothetical protein